MNKQQIALLQSFGINPEHLVDTYGETTIQRGLTYQRRKQATVLSASHEDEDTLLITGKVAGSYSPLYMTKVTMEKYDSNKGVGCLVDSFCTCPVTTDCKHGIALLFEALHQLQDEKITNNFSSADMQAHKEQKQLEDWLQAIEHEESTLTSDTQAAKPEQKQRIVYILDTTPNAPDQLRILPYKSTALKKGGYGQIYALHPNEILEANPFSTSKVFHTTTDEYILRVLLALPEYSTWRYRDDGWRFIGELAEILLPKLLKTERCFWETQKSQPLQLGEERPLDIQWQKKSGYMVAQPQTQPSVDHVITIEHLYYIDTQRHALGLLKHKNLSQSQILHFLNAPPIPKKLAKQVSEKLMRLLPDTDAPLPEQLNIKTVDITDAVPVPRLLLHAEPLSSSANKLHLASLVFVYDGIPSQPKTDADLAKRTRVILQEKIRYRITANHAHEQQAIHKLHRLGLQELEPTPTFGVLDMVMSGYSLRDSVLRWDDFITDQLPALEQAGWEVHIDTSFQLQVDTIDEWQAEIEESEGSDWFELSLGFELDGKNINLLPLLVNLLAENPDTRQLRQQLSEKDHELFQLDAHQWIKLPTKRIITILDTLVELYDTDALTANGNLTFFKHEGLHYGDLLNDPQLRWKGAEELKTLHNKLQSFSGIEQQTLPEGLNATLREYQQTGYNWLQFLRNYAFNGILADDMGLGKTIQTLSSLLREKESGRATLPSLVIAPTSLMSNWQREAKRFAPDLSVLILQGAKRKEHFDTLASYDVVLTTYPLILRDAAIYDDQQFHYLILDEAQAIKNAKSKSTQQIYSLKANHRLCLTGTPIENHLGELWSMFHFLMPGYLGTQERFNRLFRKPIEKESDEVRGEQLRKRVQPFMLRRTKDLVTTELPEKTEIIRTVALSGKQRDLYETVRLAMDKKVRDEISKKGLARSHIIVLEALLKLRQVCCDPQLVKLTKAKSVKESAKLELLMSLVPEMVEAGRKILIFSQFTTMLGIIETALKKEKISYSKLTGQTRKREEAIAAFQEGDAEVFLISLKAGGVGLNLTAADTVIHYDPWWNPAVEQQATDRAYRIGQDKPVFVYKLLTEETVEEKILAMQAKKQALANNIYSGGKQQEAAFGQDDLVELLKPLS